MGGACNTQGVDEMFMYKFIRDVKKGDEGIDGTVLLK
jgi:hypothetical protein